MNEHTERRALNAFSAMGNLPDNYVLAAENALYEAEAGLYRPEKARGPILRFLNSGVGVALISGIAALAAIALIVRAGQAPGMVTPPTPMDSAIESQHAETTDKAPEEDGLPFILSTDRETYEEGIRSFTVILTGKTPGEDISLPGEWHLYQVVDGERVPVVGMYYTGEEMRGIAPDENTCATLTKTIFINPHNSSNGLAPGRYIIGAHVETESGSKAVECAFEVIARDGVTDPDCKDTDDQGHDTVTPNDPPADEVEIVGDNARINFTLSTDSRYYLKGITSFVVKLTGKNPGETISLPGEWHLYQVVDGEREPVVGMYYTDEEVYGTAPDENTCATLTKTMFINPHNTSGGLAAGTYVLCACVETESGSEAVECAFEVVSQTAALGTDDTYHGGVDRFYITNGVTHECIGGVDRFYITSGVDRFYIASGVTYECIDGGIFQCCKDKGSDIFITVDAPYYIGTDTFHDYITSDGKVYHLVDHSRT